MAEYKEILYEKQRGGVLITLNRPEALNAITRPMLKEIHHALDEAEADPEIRAIVLTGAANHSWLAVLITAATAAIAFSTRWNPLWLIGLAGLAGLTGWV